MVVVHIQDEPLVLKDYPLDKLCTACVGKRQLIKIEMSFVSLMDTIQDSSFFFSWYLQTPSRNFLPPIMSYNEGQKCC